MDDLKIFIRTEAHLGKALSIVKTFTDDISMEFGLDKCAIAIMKGSKQIKSQLTIRLQFKASTASKYLGIENSGIRHCDEGKNSQGILSQSASHSQIRIEF